MKSVLVYSICTVMLNSPCFAEDLQQLPADQNVQKGAAAYRVFIDPQTGRIIPPPEADKIPSEQQMSSEEIDALDTSSVGLLERRKDDGSYMVDLKGRFQSTVYATRKADGSVVIRHQPMDENVHAGQLPDKADGKKGE